MQKKIVFVSIMMSCAMLVSEITGIPTISQQFSQSSTLQSLKQNHHTKVTDCINKWVQELAKQEEFKHFADASYKVSSVGPGTHSWIAWLNNENGDTIGYLIVHATEDGQYRLGEYGLGEFTPLEDQSFSFMYYDPLHVIYASAAESSLEQEQVYIEPFQLEEYPLDSSSLQKQVDTLTYQTASVQSSITLSQSTAYFSPYERLPWLSSKPLNSQFEHDDNIETYIEFDEHLYVTAYIWDKAVFTSFAATASHEWDENILYIGLQQDNESIRFIPYEFLLEHTLFYYSS